MVAMWGGGSLTSGGATPVAGRLPIATGGSNEQANGYYGQSQVPPSSLRYATSHLTSVTELICSRCRCHCKEPESFHW